MKRCYFHGYTIQNFIVLIWAMKKGVKAKKYLLYGYRLMKINGLARSNLEELNCPVIIWEDSIDAFVL